MDHHTLEEGNTLNIDFQKLKKGFEQNWIIDGPNKIIVDKEKVGGKAVFKAKVYSSIVV